MRAPGGKSQPANLGKHGIPANSAAKGACNLTGRNAARPALTQFSQLRLRPRYPAVSTSVAMSRLHAVVLLADDSMEQSLWPVNYVSCLYNYIS